MKVTAVIVGYGDRGSVYGKYAIDHPELFEIVGVCDPNSFKLSVAKERFKLDDSRLFSSFEEFIKKDKFADGVILCTMDELHYSQGKAVLKKKYNLLIEKPVVNNRKQLLELRDLANKNNLFMMVGHVLRYTPFYSSIKKEILDGNIGTIVSMETTEYVGIAHTSYAFARGKWKSEKECGSPMLLAKCCHDLDLLCWLNNDTKPVRVSSMGDRTNVVRANAPKDAADRCTDCPHFDSCIYSAKSLSLLSDIFPHYSFPNFKKPHNEITEEEKIEALKKDDPFGVCIYKTDSDLVDHQSLLLKFANGSTATHSMISFVPRPGRGIHIIGTKGEIEGFFEENKYVVRTQNFASGWYTKREVDVDKMIDKTVGHGGGDSVLIGDFVRVLSHQEPSFCTTKIDDSVASHICCYKAQEAMVKNKIEKIKF